MFQSRLGFSGRLDTHVGAYCYQSTPCFNPVLGFLVVSTPESREHSPQQHEFQSRLGFSGRLDVFTLHRRPQEVAFQSRLGFSGRLDQTTRTSSKVMTMVSIPSWVFWSSRPSGRTKPSNAATSFNPVLGFLVVSTRIKGFQRPRQRRVSIPSWVFWSSRRTMTTIDWPEGASFNPVLGFLVVSTLTADCHHCRPRPFQSRLGFSGRLDCRPRQCRLRLRSVSIPSWVFWSSRRGATYCQRSSSSGFNPVLGFLVVSTTCGVIRPRRYSAFQSRLGFSGRLDTQWNIPGVNTPRFNPVLGFLVVSTVLDVHQLQTF